MIDAELLDQKVIGKRGRFQRIRRWWRGIHPDRGVIIKGWTGWETVEEKDHVIPVRTFSVGDRGLRRKDASQQKSCSKPPTSGHKA